MFSRQYAMSTHWTANSFEQGSYYFSKTIFPDFSRQFRLFTDLDGINDYFANIATDPQYDSNLIEQLVGCLPHSDNSRDVLFSKYEVFNMLSKVKKSAAGIDKFSHWLFCKCAGVLVPDVTHVFSIILSCGNCPAAWKCAVVTPVPTVSPPTEFKDLCLISVTPILSRLF
jgi:hypothetical protein